MPTLADIYSAADSFKRRLSDAASNPSGALSQMLGYANDRARNFNELSRQAADEAIASRNPFANGPANQALDQAYMETAQVPAITVWHGSPHVFEKFDLGKLGTGTGQQVYGKGLYMADNPSTARDFQVNLSGYSPSAKASLRRFNNDFDAAIESEQNKLANYQSMVDANGPNSERAKSFLNIAKQNIEDLNLMRQGVEESKGALYKVDLPDTHVRRMLDWDAPIKDQPYPVRNLAKKLGMDMNDLGGDLLAKVGKDEEGRQILQQAGIPGVKYYDQMKGGPDQWKRNFVVFDPNHLTILERNAKPINQSVSQQTPATISKSLVEKYPNVTLDVFESPKAIDLSRIVVPKEMRGKGIGSSVMQDLIDYADETGKQVRLSPSSEFGGNVSRLKDFYKEFGFVENKGRNKDFSTRETMIRNPSEE